MTLRPYYDADGVTLYLGDVREIAPALAASGVKASVVLADPPYGETSLAWDRRVPGWPALARPLLALGGSLWCWGSMRMHRETVADFAGWTFAQDVVWEKQNGSGFDTDRFKRVHEIACHYYPDDAQWAQVHHVTPKIAGERRPAAAIRERTSGAHRGDIAAGGYAYGDTRIARSVIFARNCHGYAENETQKSEATERPLVEYSSPPGGLVLSFFSGSGTDLKVARDLGRRAIGIELREQQCEVIVRRLSQRSLFSPEAA